jgi:hypothetical protein
VGRPWWEELRHLRPPVDRETPQTPSITFTGPNGWKYTSKVQDKDALAKVKVGDKVEITWTEAVLVSVEPGT